MIANIKIIVFPGNSGNWQGTNGKKLPVIKEKFCVFIWMVLIQGVYTCETIIDMYYNMYFLLCVNYTSVQICILIMHFVFLHRVCLETLTIIFFQVLRKTGSHTEHHFQLKR